MYMYVRKSELNACTEKALNISASSMYSSCIFPFILHRIITSFPDRRVVLFLPTSVTVFIKSMRAVDNKLRASDGSRMQIRNMRKL